VTLTTDVRPAPIAETADEPEPRRRRWLSVTLTVLAAGIVFGSLVVPDTLGRPHSIGYLGAFLRIPVEGLIGAAVLMLLPRRPRWVLAPMLGAALGVLTVLKVTDVGFKGVLGRRFDPVLDLPLFGNGYDYVNETYGTVAAVAAVTGLIVLVLAVIVITALATLRLADLAAKFRRPASGTVAGLTAVWLVFALLGTTFYKDSPVASDSTLALARTTARQIPQSLHDEAAFAAEARQDAFAGVPANQLLAGLRGKDVVISVVESYGKSALTDPRMAKIVDPALTTGAKALTDAGFAARSGWLTSATYGGGSWLAHSTFQSGLWINNQGRYRQLVAGKRLTLTRAFAEAGWETAAIEPGNHKVWPEAKFYGYDETYDSSNLGYHGPKFAWSSMPDQFTFGAFQKNVYGRPHKPLMAEITMTSSHAPWTAVPTMVGWNQLGDGSIYGPMEKQVQHDGNPRDDYAKSIAYSLTSMTSWASTYGDDNLVMIFFGDHQPESTVSGSGADHDIPITIVAKDKAVLDRIAGWGWADGIKPAASTPVWGMDQFRDRFLTAFASPPPARH
jgi:uncharacterized membrane protein